MDKNNNKGNILFLKYKISNDEKDIRIFGDQFVENNKGNLRLTINDKEIEFCPILKRKYFNDNKNKIIELKLEEIKIVSNASYMFLNCESLISFNHNSDLDLTNVTNISHLFSGCSLLLHLPDISKWNFCNLTVIDSVFLDVNLY